MKAQQWDFTDEHTKILPNAIFSIKVPDIANSLSLATHRTTDKTQTQNGNFA